MRGELKSFADFRRKYGSLGMKYVASEGGVVVVSDKQGSLIFFFKKTRLQAPPFFGFSPLALLSLSCTSVMGFCIGAEK